MTEPAREQSRARYPDGSGYIRRDGVRLYCEVYGSGGSGLDEKTTRELCGRVRCPVLVIQGTADAITGAGRGIALAEAAGGRLVLLEGAGHTPHVRDPVRVNLLLRDFAARAAALP
ncbi:MAG TPA: alpha/beta hydrolase [Streptosporangiaceae bacterium]